MIMIENYLSGLIWDIYTSSAYIQERWQCFGFHQKKPESQMPEL